MAVMPTVKAASTPNPDDMMATLDPNADKMSPTTMIFKAMQDAGVPLNAGNIRRWVEAQARNTGEPASDLVPGLRSNMPSQDDGPSVGKGRGSVAKQVEGSADNPPGVDLGKNPYGDEGPNANPTSPTRPGGTPSNVATPQGGPPLMVDPGSGTPGTLPPSDGSGPDWLSALTPAFIAALIQGAAGLGGRGGGAEFVGNAQMPSGRMMDVNPPAIGADGIPTLQVTGQRPQIGGPQPAPPMAPPPTALEAPMQRAMDAPPLSGVRPFTPNPADVIQQSQALPAGINPMSVPTQPTGPGTQIVPQNVQGAPQVPLRPGAGARGPMPGVGVGLGQRILGGLRMP